MILPTLTSADFQPVIPALLLVLGAVLLLLSEVFLSTTSRGYQAAVAFLFSLGAGAYAVSLLSEPSHEVFRSPMGDAGMAVLDPFSSFLTFVVCVGLCLAILLAAGFLRHRNAERGEFYALMLFAGAGMSLLALSNELITLFINLEVLSVATYALAAYLRRGTRPSEAGFKYFILGAFSTAVLLYGVALLYGATGSTNLSKIMVTLPRALNTSPGLVYLGALLILAGFSFKIAAVPFHMWTPDVYEGAPTPVTALMSAGVKAAAFAAMIRVFLSLSRNMEASRWEVPLLVFSVLALLTMIGGNLLAIPQRNVKRMLAYSSIAHAGYVLVGVASLFVKNRPAEGVALLAPSTLISGPSADVLLRADALRGILFYLLAYTVTALGAFGLVSALERREDEVRGTAWDLERFAGLGQRKPLWAFAMAAFMLSLGGIPPTVGFMAKLLIFRSAIDSGLLGLAIVGVLSSAAGVYYYLRVVVYMFMRPATSDEAPARQWQTELALALSTIAVFMLGIAPGPVSAWLGRAGELLALK